MGRDEHVAALVEVDGHLRVVGVVCMGGDFSVDCLIGFFFFSFSIIIFD